MELRSRIPTGLLIGAVVISSGCAKKTNVPVAAAPAPTVDWPVKSRDFIDLLPGWRVRQTTPVLASGGYVAKGTEQVEGTTITLSGSDIQGHEIQGYETALYGMKPAPGGGATADLTSVVTTTLSKTGDQQSTETASRAPLFPFPRSVRYIRLMYLVRISSADHNMAVLASNDVDRLNSFTRQLQDDPSANCRDSAGVYCSWVPLGVAVNPEIHALVSPVFGPIVSVLPPFLGHALEPVAMEWVPAR